jgi:hypothetical protein
MYAALRGSCVKYVIYMGMMESYPEWFKEEIADRILMDDSRYTVWTSPPERMTDYFEKDLIETHSIVLRKDDGTTHIAECETFDAMYHIFTYDQSVNGGIAAFKEDVIEYVEVVGGVVADRYPEWFYAYFTESLNNPKDNETYLFNIDGHGYMTVKDRCVVLRNRFNELRQMTYADFLKYYDPDLTDFSLLI